MTLRTLKHPVISLIQGGFQQLSCSRSPGLSIASVDVNSHRSILSGRLLQERSRLNRRCFQNLTVAAVSTLSGSAQDRPRQNRSVKLVHSRQLRKVVTTAVEYGCHFRRQKMVMKPQLRLRFSDQDHKQTIETMYLEMCRYVEKKNS